MTIDDLRNIMKGVSKDIDVYLQDPTKDVWDNYAILLVSKRLRGRTIIRVERHNTKLTALLPATLKAREQKIEKIISEMCLQVVDILLNSGWHYLVDTTKELDKIRDGRALPKFTKFINEQEDKQ